MRAIAMLTKFGKVVRKHRIDEQMKLGEMAEGVGVSAAYLSAVENGKKKLTDDLVGKVADFLRLQSEELDQLWMAAKLSRAEHTIDVSRHDELRRETTAMFARSIESSTLSEDKAKRILEILNS